MVSHLKWNDFHTLICYYRSISVSRLYWTRWFFPNECVCCCCCCCSFPSFTFSVYIFFVSMQEIGTATTRKFTSTNKQTHTFSSLCHQWERKIQLWSHLLSPTPNMHIRVLLNRFLSRSERTAIKECGRTTVGVCVCVRVSSVKRMIN